MAITKPAQQTQEQERAKQAWADVSGVVAQHGAKGKDAQLYKSLAKSAPADIQTNGLGQTVAFWRAKGKYAHTTLYGHVSIWLKGRMTCDKELHLWIIDPQTSASDYRRATVETLAYLGWLKRFAEAEIEGEEEPT